MVKFKATGDDGVQLIGFGLTRANVERLVAGQPIRVFGEDMDLPNQKFMIFFGETEAEMEAMLRSHNLIDADTRIHR